MTAPRLSSHGTIVPSPPLSDMTTLRLGGPARVFVTVDSEEQLIDVVRAADRADEPVFVLAGGSNVVVADDGFDGTAVRIATLGRSCSQRADGKVELDVAAGEDWDSLVASCVAEGLAGIEALSGIPGSVGATPIQNVGAYGQQVADVIVGVRVLDRRSGETLTLTPEQCDFGYRRSIFRHAPADRWLVLSVCFALTSATLSEPIGYDELADYLVVDEGDRVPLAELRDAVVALRGGKGMVLDPCDPDSVSAGSFFKNPVMPVPAFEELQALVAERYDRELRGWPDGPDMRAAAACLIEEAGFGPGYGSSTGIAISSKHSLALTNRGGGTTAELVALAHEIAAGVRTTFGIELVPEPVFIGHDWQPLG